MYGSRKKRKNKEGRIHKTERVCAHIHMHTHTHTKHLALIGIVIPILRLGSLEELGNVKLISFGLELKHKQQLQRDLQKKAHIE